ncbi:MAG: bifunctional (p)ppGpp synthetase/guanosine-3',5'-bis(diphosphate) 3'-pyrophosphohydrolase [Candidatus Liptonbacteria bacterium]|nr:bifunctional (p)ppGpp synthetase/guanosine-3',5'-bis(diphosphate) 3'-pyrophosphohydrolase [Candidatus Liptonbacteria bacterium]
MTVKESIKKNPDGIIARAYAFAEKSHKGQSRKNGEAYFNHALAAANNVASWNLDDESVAAALLHDVVEDTDVTLEKLKREFGEEIAFLVDGVTKIGKIRYRGIENQVENLRKMLLALSEDIRVIIIKLGDRLHNMKTLSSVPREKQRRIALETMEIYSPIAYRLGMQHLSGELEDLAFPYIYPQEYTWLKKEVKDAYEKRAKYLERVKKALLQELQKNKLHPLFIDFRAKRYASLYKKLLRYDMDINKIYDLVALRVIMENVSECYAALGIVHNLWPPVPGRIKDYIAMPKPNGYRSLHTTIICLDEVITEIQIKTKEMHEEAENGIAAHWLYEQTKGTGKNMQKRSISPDKKELQWVEQLRNWQKEFSNPEEFLDSLKIDFFRDRIFVITPRGEVRDLPVGATPIDFAYQIHSDVGNSCSGAKVNGKIVTLDHQLQSGNVVEIITQKNKKPSSSWLNFVKTAGARNKIKSALKGSDSLAAPTKLARIEFKITAEDKLGLLKDVTTIISRAHVNIVSVNTGGQGASKFHVLKILCDGINKDKAEKLAIKLKSVKEIKELSYKFI